MMTFPKKTKDAFDELCICQNRALTTLNSETFAVVAEASLAWNHLASTEEKFYWQKSRLNWMKHGDHNTAFFHRTTQTRASKNSIKRLISANGVELTDFSEIKKEAAAHFQQFLQTRPDNIEEVSVQYLEEILEYRCPENIASSLWSVTLLQKR